MENNNLKTHTELAVNISEIEQHPITKQNNSLPLYFGGVILLIVGLGSGYYLGTQNSINSTAQIPESAPAAVNRAEGAIFCTMDAKLCPDGSSVGRISPNCEFAACSSEPGEPEGISNITEFIVASNVSQFDENGDDLPGSSVNIILDLPDGSSRSRNVATIYGKEYQISVNQFAGLCGMIDDGSGCGYDDEQVPVADVLRVWKNNNGVIALNLISPEVEEYYLRSIVVTKNSDDHYESFSNEEVTLWKKILLSLRAEKNGG